MPQVFDTPTDGLGDTSTLADPGVVTDLVSGRVG